MRYFKIDCCKTKVLVETVNTFTIRFLLQNIHFSEDSRIIFYIVYTKQECGELSKARSTSDFVKTSRNSKLKHFICFTAISKIKSAKNKQV